jgi:hypothetical protein
MIKKKVDEEVDVDQRDQRVYCNGIYSLSSEKRNCRQISKSAPQILSVFRICNFQQKLEETLVFPCSSLKLDALLHPRINDFTFFNVQSLCSATRVTLESGSIPTAVLI